MEQLKVIALVNDSKVPLDMALFEWLAYLFPVRFQTVRPDCWGGSDAAIFFGLEPSSPGLPSLQIPAATILEIPASLATVQFGQSAGVPKIFRGRTIMQENLTCNGSLKINHGDQIIATSDGKPLWVVREDGLNRTDSSAMPLTPEKNFWSLQEDFAARNFLRLLPLIDFLRRVVGDYKWENPGLRACFMFDDPNLHRPRYGYVDFRELAASADNHNYHTSFATVPLDGWFVHQKTADLFRNNASRISLLCHGNNHTTNELAGIYPDAERHALLGQALLRIKSIEQRSGVEVSRVMAAPHGACSEMMMRDMARLGFEAACISHGSVRAHNQDKDWTKKTGLAMAEMATGLPIIPRFRISADCKTEILLAAFLNQPIIPVGHHEDIAGGPSLLEDLAAFINSIGDVQWLDMKSIARSNFYSCREGQTLYVNMYSRRIQLKVPEGVAYLCIERQWLNGAEREDLMCGENQGAWPVNNFYQGGPIPVKPGIDVWISSICPNQIDPHKISAGRVPLWVLVRRGLCEIRDRMKPLLKRNF